MEFVYYVLTRREELLQYLPKNGVGVEIGVAEGTYADAILATAQPSKLHLIDPWTQLETGSDLLGSNEMLIQVEAAKARGETFGSAPNHPVGDKTYGGLVERYKDDPRVQLHRGYSYKVVSEFEDGYFDFVYIDGNHNYEFVLRDLQDFAAKLKPGGLLFGHDFFEDDFARKENYGVVDAVSVFVKRSGFRFVMLTWEPFSTFCLARTLDGCAGKMLRNVFESDVPMIEMPDSLVSNYRDKSYKGRNGVVKRIPSFINSPQFQLA